MPTCSATTGSCSTSPPRPTPCGRSSRGGGATAVRRTKNLIVVDAQTGARVANVARVSITRETGEIVFQPTSGKGRYFVYYLPNVGSGRSNYPKVTYPEPEQTAAPDWLQKHAAAQGLPAAAVVEFQAIDELNTFFPMEVIATAAETTSLEDRHRDKPYLLFPEDRRFPIRMTDDLPQRWITAGANRPFRGEAARGEYYAFQVGVFASRGPIQNLQVRFADLRGPKGALIKSSAFSCFNVGGRDWTGKTFVKALTVPSGKVQALWMGVQVPAEAASGEYVGSVTVEPAGLAATTVPVTLVVSNQSVPDAGDNEPMAALAAALARLDARRRRRPRSRRTPPWTSRADIVSVLGRRVSIGDDGLPRSHREPLHPGDDPVGDTPRAGAVRARRPRGRVGGPCSGRLHRQRPPLREAGARRGRLGIDVRVRRR